VRTPNEGDGRYSYQAPWELTSTTLEMQRRQQADVAPAWYPAIVPQPDPREMVPPMYGYRTSELTISDILNGYSSRLDSSKMMDFSGQQGGYEGSMRPTGAGGGGVT
jgi:hypothetical protein